MKDALLRIALRNFAVLLVAACITYYASDLEQALLVVSIGSVFASIVSIFELRLRQKMEHASELSVAFFMLRQISDDIRYGGKSTYSSIEGAMRSLRSNTNSKVRKVIGEIRMRLMCGQDLGQAINSTCGSEDDAASVALSAVGKEYQKSYDAGSAAKNVYTRLWKSQSLSKEKAYGSLQKYLTISMALSAVLPSFVVFAFVGYSMVYYSAALLSVFCIMMLVVLPSLYAMLKMHIAGVYA